MRAASEEMRAQLLHHPSCFHSKGRVTSARAREEANQHHWSLYSHCHYLMKETMFGLRGVPLAVYG